MRTVGVVAEYNPFHPGHAHQLREARRLSGADAVVVVMSSCFTQRGEAALLAPSVRARMALRCGADAVFALPAVWAVRDAEHFALGGVALLQGLGMDAISFGAESADGHELLQAARLLESPDTAVSSAVQACLARGLPYPAALSEAYETVHPGVGALLRQPNNTLAVCYLRAMLRLNAAMEVFPVARRTDYHDTALGHALPSATALRGAILRGDWQGALQAMNAENRALLQEEALAGRLHRPQALDLLLLHRLRSMSPEARRLLPDVSEGVEDRLFRAAMTASSREALLQEAKTRRYPYARLSRLCAHALLGFTQPMLAAEALPRGAWLLGFRKERRDVLRQLSQGSIPLIARAADGPRDEAWFDAELRAYELWALGAGLPGGLGLRQGVVRE